MMTGCTPPGGGGMDRISEVGEDAIGLLTDYIG
jgi:hypothetical protein